MSKSQNYIIVLGGVFAIIFVLIMGLLKYFFYQSEQIESGKQIVDMLIAIIPAIILCAITMVGILNYVEKKEVKAATILNIELRNEIIKKEEDNRKTLNRIEENITINESLENQRNEELKKVHKSINTRMSIFERWMRKHKKEHTTK